MLPVDQSLCYCKYKTNKVVVEVEIVVVLEKQIGRRFYPLSEVRIMVGRLKNLLTWRSFKRGRDELSKRMQ